MVTKADNVESTETPTGEPQFTPDQYKKLQREVNKWKERARELAEQNADHTALPARIELLQEQLQALMEAVGATEALPEEQRKKLAETKVAVGGKKQRTDQVAKVHGDINSFLEEHDLDWGAPELEAARKAWSEGDVDKAYQAVLASVTAKPKEVDIDALVAEKVTAKLKELGKVDTKESTTTAGSGTIETMDRAEFLKLTPEQRGELWRKRRNG